MNYLQILPKQNVCYSPAFVKTCRLKASTSSCPPVKDQSAFDLGMIRIIQAKPVLQLYAAAHPEEEMNIDLIDNELSANNGYYYLNKGKCMYSHRRLPGAHERLTIGQLTEKNLCFGTSIYEFNAKLSKYRPNLVLFS